MGNEKLVINKKYILSHCGNEITSIVTTINKRIDFNDSIPSSEQSVGMNDIASVAIKSSKPLFADAYIDNKVTASFILIDTGTNETVGVGMIQ